MSELPTIYRCPMRSGLFVGDREQHRRQLEYARSKGIVGVGWGLPDDPPTTLAETVERIRSDPGPGRGSRSAKTIERFANAPMGSLVWSLHTDGRWLLGRIASSWYPDYSPEAFEFDMHQLRDCQWVPRLLLSEEVPGGVIRAFSGRGSSFSRITDRAARLYSAALFAELTETPVDLPSPTRREILCSHLAPFDVEDLVFTYLQVERGYLVLPAARRTNNPTYEWSVVERSSGRLVPVSIKTGESHVDIGELAETASDTGKAIAYSTAGHYDGDGKGRVELLADDDLLAYTKRSPHLLPPRVHRWMEQARD